MPSFVDRENRLPRDSLIVPSAPIGFHARSPRPTAIVSPFVEAEDLKGTGTAPAKFSRTGYWTVRESPRVYLEEGKPSGFRGASKSVLHNGRRKYDKHVEAIAPETGSCLTIMYWSTKRVSE